jgi:hypothetical protein
MLKNNIKLKLIILIGFAALTFAYFKPLFLNIDTFLPGNEDELHLTWAINSMAKNFSISPVQLFSGNIFYPFPLTRAYGDPLIFSSLIAKLSFLFSPEPVTSFNLNLLLSQALLLFFSFLFFKALTENLKLAVFFSLVYGFSSIHLHYLHHINYFSVQFLPLAGYFLLKLVLSKKPLYLYLFFLSFLLQALNSFLLGFFVVFLSLGLIVIDQKLRLTIFKNYKHLFLNLLLATVVLVPVIKVYFQISRYFHYVVPLTDVIHFSLSPEEVITKFFSPALYFIFIFCLLMFFKTKVKNKKSLGFLLLALFSFILSLGPALHWMRQTIKIPFHIPLPYLLFYFLIPGFKSFRVPSRFMLLTAFLSLVFSSFVIKSQKKYFKKFEKLFYLTIFLLLVLTTPKFKSFVKISKIQDYPQVYHWLKEENNKVIIELPIAYWGQGQAFKQEHKRLLYSLYHQQKLVNGAASFTPPQYYKLVELINSQFLSEKTLNKLKQINVDYIIIHKQEYNGKINLPKNTDSLKLVKAFENDLVYEIKKN